jgi:3-oxoacyl-[acyl-carrier-protein] synthase II
MVRCSKLRARATAGLTELDPALHIDVVTGTPRPWEPGPAMSNSFGFGGHNGTVILVPA